MTRRHLLRNMEKDGSGRFRRLCRRNDPPPSDGTKGGSKKVETPGKNQAASRDAKTWNANDWNAQEEAFFAEAPPPTQRIGSVLRGQTSGKPSPPPKPRTIPRTQPPRSSNSSDSSGGGSPSWWIGGKVAAMLEYPGNRTLGLDDRPLRRDNPNSPRIDHETSPFDNSLQLTSPDSESGARSAEGNSRKPDNGSMAETVRSWFEPSRRHKAGRSALELARNAGAMMGLVRCSVCGHFISPGPGGMVSWVSHPYFRNERICTHHVHAADGNHAIRRCTSCHRWEPTKLQTATGQVEREFADLNDDNRCVCLACCRSVVVHVDDAKPLYAEVLDFFEHHLDLRVWDGMRNIPVLVVGQRTLNSHLQNSQHYFPTSEVQDEHAAQRGIRGLCLTTHHIGLRIPVPSVPFNFGSLLQRIRGGDGGGENFFQIPSTGEKSSNRGNDNSKVTAIMCLFGLPKDLTGSILAHEATHAWLKRHPGFRGIMGGHIPSQVEEGCCELVAHLYLQWKLEQYAQLKDANNGVQGPTDQELCQYFRYAVETNPDEVYGGGFRKAASIHTKIGLEALLTHVVQHKAWPEV